MGRFGLLGVALAGGLLVVLCFQAWLLVSSQRNAVRTFEVRAANRAHANANHVAGIFRNIDLVLQDLRDHMRAGDTRLDPDSERAAEIHALIRQRMQRMPRLVNLHVISADGHFVHSSRAPLPTVTIADRPYFMFQRDAKADEMVLSPPVLGRVSGTWAVFCSRRLVAPDGSFAGLILAGIEADDLAEEMQAVDQQDWVLALVHGGRLLATRQPADPDRLGQIVDQPVLEWLADGTDTYRGAGLGEEGPHLWGRAEVPGLPLVAIAGYDEHLALSQWRKDLRTHFVAIALLVAGAIALLVQQRRRDRATASADRLDRQLRSSELALAGLVRRVPVGVFRLQAGDSGTLAVAFASQRCQEVLGHVPVDPSALMDLVHEQDRSGLRQHLAEAAASGEFGWTGRIGQGHSVRWLEVRASASDHGPGGREWNGVVQDITRRREAEVALQRQQDLMRAVFNHAPIGILLGGPEGGSTTFSNPAASSILGLRVDGIIGNGLESVVLAVDADRLRQAVRQAREAGPEHLQIGCRTGDGRAIDLDVVVSVIRDADGRAMNGLLLFRDITSERRLAVQVRHAEKMQAVGLLAGGIAHDFNNILAAISGFTELARRRRPAEPVASHLEQIGAAADRAKTLVRQILAFSRQDQSEPRPVHLQSTVREVMGMLRATLPSSVEMQADMSQDVGPVMADAGRIHQVVMNLCSNAVHAMRGNGRLQIRLEQVRLAGGQPGRLRTLDPGSYAQLTVADSGCGMDAATLERIFDPFFTTKGPQEGTGLGLAVVWGVVESHHGDIQVESHPGHGTAFRILLPVIDRPVSDPALADALQTAGGSEHILLVDDEPSLRAILAEMLGDLGYRIETCGNGQEAYSLLRHRRGDIRLVITDETMPGMTGSELIAAVAPLHPDLRFILCSGLECTGPAGVPADRVQRCMKPVGHAILAAMVRRGLDGAAPPG